MMWFVVVFWAVVLILNWRFNQRGPKKVDKDLEQLTGLIGAARAKRELDRLKALHPRKSKKWAIQQLVRKYRP